MKKISLLSVLHNPYALWCCALCKDIFFVQYNQCFTKNINAEIKLLLSLNWSTGLKQDRDVQVKIEYMYMHLDRLWHRLWCSNIRADNKSVNWGLNSLAAGCNSSFNNSLNEALYNIKSYFFWVWVK